MAECSSKSPSGGLGFTLDDIALRSIGDPTVPQHWQSSMVSLNETKTIRGLTS
jgi:hypothetical protein